MYFYPRTLKSHWYIEDVCSSIHASLDGTKRWTMYYFERDVERDAYVHAFQTCQEIVERCGPNPKAMLEALDSYHDSLASLPKPPFFSLTRWFYDVAEARDRAVRTAFEIVDGISKRFL